MVRNWKRVWSIMLAFALVLTSITLPTASQKAGAADSVFTLYFYSGEEADFYMNIWNHAGITFASDAETDYTFGWDHPQGKLQAVEDNADWYQISLTVLDASADDGFNIYKDNGDDSSKVASYSQKWDNAEDYAVLVGGSQNAYAVKDGTLYTDLSEAGLTVDSSGEATAAPAQPTVQPAQSSLYVKRISNMDEDFIRGVDISSVYAEYESGVKYYDFDGNELALSPKDGEKGFFAFLKECGVNWVRIRIWNDPYDSNGNGYGGGNNDLAKAKIIGKAASDAGLQVLIDFHYSDFWADPKMQAAPKAWKDFDLSQKSDAVKTFTTESLQELLDAGVEVGMVQIGNETNNGLCGETTEENICTLMNAGSSAVRAVAEAYETEILVAVHYTNIQNQGYYEQVAKMLDANQVDYDVFATSYYPFWHGTTSNLTSVLKTIATTYNKKVMVAETSYAYTLEDGDGHENTAREGVESLDFAYTTSVQGQANVVSSVMQAVCNIGDAGIGVFYWEPAWIPVNVYQGSTSEKEEILKANKTAWETYGSGWASSYSAEYDPDNAGQWYGGSSWDNQAMFDFWGKPLESINVYKYVLTGTTASAKLETVNDTSLSVTSDSDWKMPETVTAKYTDNSEKEVAVSWVETEVEKARKAGDGTYTIHGTVTADGTDYEVLCALEIKPANLLKNPGFEEGADGTWTLNGTGVEIKEEASNVRSGEFCLKYYNETDAEFTAEQTVVLNKGVYQLGAYNQGGAGSDAAKEAYQLYIVINGKKQAVDSSVSSWQEWENPTISDIQITSDNTKVTIGIYTKYSAGGWGSWDDLYLGKTGEITSTETPKPSTTTVTKPAKVTGVKAKAGKKKATISWKKVKKAAGYQIKYAAKKSFKGAKTVTVKSTSKVIKKLKSKKTYYVKVRAYKVSGKKKVYGKYSKVVKVKVK